MSRGSEFHVRMPALLINECGPLLVQYALYFMLLVRVSIVIYTSGSGCCVGV